MSELLLGTASEDVEAVTMENGAGGADDKTPPVNAGPSNADAGSMIEGER